MADVSNRASCPGGAYCVCLKCIDSGGLQKLQEFKGDLTIYRHKEPEVQSQKQITTQVLPLPGATSTVQDARLDEDTLSPDNIIIVINHAPESERKSANYVPEIDINKVCCPRCRYIMTHAKPVLEKVPLRQNNEVKCVCGLCYQKQQSSDPSCTFCEKAINLFLSNSQKEDDLKKKLLASLIDAKVLRQPDINNELKKRSIYSETDIRKSINTSKYFDHRLNRPTSGRTLDSRTICKCDEKLLCLFQKYLKKKKITTQVKVETDVPENISSAREIFQKAELYPKDEIVKVPALKPCLVEKSDQFKRTPYRSGFQSDTVMGVGTTGILRRSHSEESLIPSISKLPEEIYKKNFKFFFPGSKKKEKQIRKTSQELIQDTQHRLREQADQKIKQQQQSALSDFEKDKIKHQLKEESKRLSPKKDKTTEKAKDTAGPKVISAPSEKRHKLIKEKEDNEVTVNAPSDSKPPGPHKKEKTSMKGKAPVEPEPLSRPPEKEEKAEKEKTPSERKPPKTTEKKEGDRKEKAPSEPKSLKTSEKKEGALKVPRTTEKGDQAGKGKAPSESKAPSEPKSLLRPPEKEEGAMRGKTRSEPKLLRTTEKEDKDRKGKASSESKSPSKTTEKEEGAGKGKSPSEPKSLPRPPEKEEGAVRGKTRSEPKLPRTTEKEDKDRKGKAPSESKSPSKTTEKEEAAGKEKTPFEPKSLPRPPEKEGKSRSEPKLPKTTEKEDKDGKGRAPSGLSEKGDKTVKEKKDTNTKKIEIPDKTMPTAKVNELHKLKDEIKVLDAVVKKQDREMTETLKDKNALGDKFAADMKKAESGVKSSKTKKPDGAQSTKEEGTKEEGKKEDKDQKEVPPKDVKMYISGDNLLASMVKMRPRERLQPIVTPKIEQVAPSKILVPKVFKKPSIRSLPSVLGSDIVINTGEPEMIIGERIVLLKHLPPEEKQRKPDLFHTDMNVNADVKDTLIKPKPETEEKHAAQGSFLYALSDRKYIEKGWTILPTEKIVRKLNVYRVRPAHPELDWFARHKDEGDLTYDTGEKLADFTDDGHGRWYYKNGRIALDYVPCEDGENRFVVYSSGCLDERGRSQPITILAMFDHNGNGIVFDHKGKIRMKYNQNEGVLLDRSLGPVTHWLWHSLNEPPHLQHVMLDTQLKYKHPEIMQFDDFGKHVTQSPDHEEMNAIENENHIKMKSMKPFQPHTINLKALRINEQFSIKILNQETIYLYYRDGLNTMKLNLGMIIDNSEIVDSSVSEIGKVELNIDKLPGKTESVANLQKIIHHVENFHRAQMERELKKIRPIPVASADKLTAPISKTPLIPANADLKCNCKTRIPFANNLYYNTRLI